MDDHNDNIYINPDNDSSRLLTLPLEVFLRITYLLKTEELGKVRLTCKRAELLLLPSFTREFFTRRQFSIYPSSLEALVEISKSRFADTLQHIHISSRIIVLYRNALLQGPGAHQAYANGLYELETTQKSMWTTGSHVMLLSEAFKNLENLQTVIIRDHESRSRHRDGYQSHWNSYGIPTLMKSFPSHSIQFSGGEEACAKVLQITLAALGAAKARPKSLELMVDRIADFGYHISSHLLPSVVPVLEGLEKLHISVSSGDLPGYNNIGEDDNMDSDMRIHHLFELLSHTTNVLDLRLNSHVESHNNRKRTATENLLERVATYSETIKPETKDFATTKGGSIDAKLDTRMLPKLEKLSLGFMEVPAVSLLRFVRAIAPNLKDLELWKVELRRWDPDDSFEKEYEEKLLWKPFLEKFKGIQDLNLKHLMLGMLKQRDYFYPHHVNFQDGKPKVQYTGPLWTSFIDDILPHVAAPSFFASRYLDFSKLSQPDLLYPNDHDDDGDDDQEEEEDDGDEEEEDDEMAE